MGEAIPFEDKKAIEDVACYVVRNPLSLKKLVVRPARVNRARLIGRDRFAIPGLDGQKAVLYRSRMNPSLGRASGKAHTATFGRPQARPARRARADGDGWASVRVVHVPGATLIAPRRR